MNFAPSSSCGFKSQSKWLSFPTVFMCAGLCACGSVERVLGAWFWFSSSSSPTSRIDRLKSRFFCGLNAPGHVHRWKKKLNNSVYRRICFRLLRHRRLCCWHLCKGPEVCSLGGEIVELAGLRQSSSSSLSPISRIDRLEWDSSTVSSLKEKFKQFSLCTITTYCIPVN